MPNESNYIGIAMGLDVTSLKAGLSEADKAIRLANSEFKKATSGLDDWTKSAEGIRAKVTQLTSVLDMQKKKLAGLQAEYDKTVKAQGENSEAARKLLTQLNNQAAVVGRTERELNNYQETLKEAESGSLDLETATLRAGKAIQKTGSDAKKSSNDVKTLEKVSKTAKTALLGLYGGITALAGGFLASAEATREFRTNMGKVETAFSTAGFSAKDAGDTYTDFYAVLGDEGKATEAVSHLGELAKSQKDLKTWTNIATGVYAKFGDSLPIEGLTEAANETAKTGHLTGVLADALNWVGASEEYFQESLDKCTTEQERQALITDTLNGLYSDASKQYKETNKDIIAANDAQAQLRLQMAEVGEMAEPVMTEFKLMGAGILKAILPVVEDMIPKIKENFPAILAGVAGITAALVTLSAASLIQKGITTALTVATTAWNTITKTVTAAQWLLNAAMNANPISILIIAIGALVAAFVVLWNKSESFREFWIGLWDKIKEVCSSAWESITGWFTDAWETIKEVWGVVADWFGDVWEGIKSVWSVVADWFKQLFTDAWEGIKTAWSNVTSWFTQLWEGIKAVWNAVTTWFGEIFTTAWEGIKTAWSNVTSWFTQLWEDIKKVFGNVSTWFKEKFDTAWSNIKESWSSVTSWFSGIWDDIKEVFSKVATWFKEKFDTAWSNIKEAFANPTKFFTDVWEDIKAVFDPKEFLKIGENLITGLWDGINGVKDWIVGKAKGVWNAITGSAKKEFDEHSPSKVFAAIGRFLGLGLAEGIEDGEGDAIEATEGMGSKIINGISSLFDSIKNSDILSGLWETLQSVGSNLLDKLGEALGIDFAKMFAEGVESESDTVAKAVETVVDPPVDTRTRWQKFADNMKAGLDKASENLQKWKDNVGKYISQVAGYFDTLTSNVMKVATAISDAFQQAWDQEMDALHERLEAEKAKRKEANDALIAQEKEKTDERKKAYQAECDTSIQSAQDEANESIAILKQQYLDGKISSEKYTSERKKLAEKLASETTRIQEDTNNKVKQLEADLVAYQKKMNDEKSQYEIDLQKKRDELGRKAFEANKEVQIANIWINAASATARAWAENFWPVALGITAAIATEAGIQTGIIEKQQYTPALAKGGVVDNPTMALIGEAGKEAVIPLERNTGWMVELADKLGRFLNEDLDLEGLRNNLDGLKNDMKGTSVSRGAGTVTNNDNTKVINAGLTVNYNGTLSRKQIRKTEEEYYRNVRRKLAMEGV